MNKRALFLTLAIVSFFATYAQDSSLERDMETSFDNMELLIIALVGLAVLMLLYFFFRKRNRKN